MNSEILQKIESYVQDGDSCFGTGDWGGAKVGYLRALEEYQTAEKEGIQIITPEDQKLCADITAKISRSDVKLAAVHADRGESFLKAKEYAQAVDELEEAITLAPENEIEFLEKVKVLLDKAQLKNRDKGVFSRIDPIVKKADDLKEDGNYAEAALEYTEALKISAGLPEEHRYRIYIQEAMTECRRALVRPYLAKVNQAKNAGKFKSAYKILLKAMVLVDEKDSIYQAFLERIVNELKANLPADEAEEMDDSEMAEDWNEAMKEYEEALSLYSSYTAVDPLAPVYCDSNRYEDRFIASRRKLGALYFLRAEKLSERAELTKALKNYKEALKLFPKADSDFHKAFQRIKQLRGKLAAAHA
ncbi:MAG: hypothetical protein HQM10_22145 [Candidatus Riflebacteria bacterium]|nr:hypothetical protein [Candidatus Riflebacteria bacterium]